MKDEDPLDREPQFGKYADSDMTWRDVVLGDAPYVEWVLENAEHRSLTPELREALQMALEDGDDEWAF